MSYLLSIEDLLKLGNEPSAAVAMEELPADHQRILLHRRLGHVYNDKLIESDCRGLVEGINLEKRYFIKQYEKAICKCNACLRSKLTRKNFRTLRPVISMDGNLRERGVVSADTMEVLNTPSMEGYVLVLKHSDAKKVWAYGLRTKCGEEIFKCMKVFVEVQLTADELRLRRYHADGAGKSVGQHIRKYLRDNMSTRSTKIAWTPRNTPEMNSLSERTNRTVKEMALALLLDSGPPSVFWYKAVKHAVYLINMLPTKTSKCAEFLTCDAPNANELKIWAARCGQSCPRMNGARSGRRKESLDSIWESVNSQWDIRFIYLTLTAPL